MMGKGGKKSNSNTYKYICKGSCKEGVNKVLFKLPFNYKYTYNLKYIKIWARHKFQSFLTLY